MGFLSIFKKKKEEKQNISPLPMESETKHIDDLDLPPFPSEQQVGLKEAQEHEKEIKETEIPEELPPIEEVPTYEDEFLPTSDVEQSKEKRIEEMPNPPQQPELKPQEQEIKQDIEPESQSIEQPKIQETNYPEKQQPIVRNNQPVFIKVSKYKEVLAEISAIRSRLNQSLKTLTRVKEIKNPEDNEFNQWKEKLEDIERKILYIDKTIFEKNQL